LTRATSGSARRQLDGVLKTNRARWARNRLTRIGLRRAQHLGGEYLTFTKKSGESILARRGRDLPIAIVRPSIVESSSGLFTGWNEGINTRGAFPIFLARIFRQLPSTSGSVRRDSRRHGLPGMTLIASASSAAPCAHVPACDFRD